MLVTLRTLPLTVRGLGGVISLLEGGVEKDTRGVDVDVLPLVEIDEEISFKGYAEGQAGVKLPRLAKCYGLML